MVVKSAIDRLRYYDWTFSNTAEYAIAALLVIVLVVMMLVIFWGS